MKFNYYKNLNILILIFSFIFCSSLKSHVSLESGLIQQEVKEISLENVIKDQVKIEEDESHENLLEDIKFLLDDILNKNFSNPINIDLADRLKLELNTKYNLIASEKDFERSCKKIKMINFLVQAQKMANAKLDILQTASVFVNQNFLSRYQIIKLEILNCLYVELQKNWKKVLNEKMSLEQLEKKFVNNEFVTKCVRSVLPSKFLNYEIQKLLEVDLYSLWPNIYSRYERLVNNYYETKIFDFDILEKLLNDLREQKEILAEIDFSRGFVKRLFGSWAGEVETIGVERIGQELFVLQKGTYDFNRKKIEEHIQKSIVIFDLFISNLIKIKNESQKASDIVGEFSSIDPDKKEIGIKFIVLKESVDFKTFSSQDDLSDYFNRFLIIVEKYLKDEEKQNEDLFKFDFYSIISDLKKLKNREEQTSIFILLGLVNKKSDCLCSLLDEMLGILENILMHSKKEVKSENVGGGKGQYKAVLESILKKILSGDIIVNDKIKTLVAAFIQAVLG